jgi:hypothetical protein
MSSLLIARMTHSKKKFIPDVHILHHLHPCVIITDINCLPGEKSLSVQAADKEL